VLVKQLVLVSEMLDLKLVALLVHSSAFGLVPKSVAMVQQLVSVSVMESDQVSVKGLDVESASEWVNELVPELDLELVMESEQVSVETLEALDCWSAQLLLRSNM